MSDSNQIIENKKNITTVLSQIILGFSLTMIAFNFRTVFTSLTVVLPDIAKDLQLNGTAMGLLTTLPVLCLGVFAPLAPYLAQKITAEKTLFFVLLLLFFGLGIRGSGNVCLLYIGASVAGAAIAMGNVLLPSVVKRDFPKNMALMTSLYTMALCGGAALAAGFTVPLKNVFNGSWQWALAFWALPVFIVMILWLLQLKKTQIHSQKQHYRVKGLLRDPLAWQVTFFMGLQSTLAYCVFGWLPPILFSRGFTNEVAGMYMSFSVFMQAISCLIVPLIAGKRSSQSTLNVALVLCVILSFLGIIFGSLSLTWFLVIILGIGQGGLLAAAMMVIVLRSQDSHVAAHLSGMAQCFGYCLASIGPYLIGVLHDFTGGFTSSTIVIVIFGLGAMVAGYLSGRPILTKTTTTIIEKHKP